MMTWRVSYPSCALSPLPLPGKVGKVTAPYGAPYRESWEVSNGAPVVFQLMLSLSGRLYIGLREPNSRRGCAPPLTCVLR